MKSVVYHGLIWIGKQIKSTSIATWFRFQVINFIRSTYLVVPTNSHTEITKNSGIEWNLGSVVTRSEEICIGGTITTQWNLGTVVTTSESVCIRGLLGKGFLVCVNRLEGQLNEIGWRIIITQRRRETMEKLGNWVV